MSTYSNTLKEEPSKPEDVWGIVAKNYHPPKGSPILPQPNGFIMSSGVAEKFEQYFK